VLVYKSTENHDRAGRGKAVVDSWQTRVNAYFMPMLDCLGNFARYFCVKATLWFIGKTLYVFLTNATSVIKPSSVMKIYQVDAFTDRAFLGNPAAVCVLENELSDTLMQQIASEMNLSETAFVRIRPDRTCHLRWFTPAIEVNLCGHATLATAHTLFEQQVFDSKEMIRFDTLSGELRVKRMEDGSLEMDFPAISNQLADIPERVVEALGTKVVFCGIAPGGTPEPTLNGTMVPSSEGEPSKDYLIEVADEATLRQLKPNFSLLQQEPVQGFIVTAPSADGKYDFVSRYFAPSAGIPEDPVTGFAHCVLTPYWAQKLDKTILSAYQASARGGELKLRLQGERVLLNGKAVTVLKGELLNLPKATPAPAV
jgi:PhzF family phenazine biosynthesis protein